MKNNSIYLIFILILFSCKKDASIDNPNIIKDIDSNNYEIIQIGNQFWLNENLKTKHFRNGDPILNGNDKQTWKNIYLNQTAIPAWCNISSSTSYSNTKELLYNGYAVNDARGICPKGWHIPTIDEFNTLFQSTGGINLCGDNLRSKISWVDPNKKATDKYRFGALGNGYRSSEYYYSTSFITYYWTTTKNLNKTNKAIYIIYDTAKVEIQDLSHEDGLSCRCIKD